MYRKSSIKPPGGLFNFRGPRGGLNREGGLLEERGGLLVVPGTYTVLSDSQGLLETLKTELDKKILTLKHMKLETGNITTKCS